MCFAPVKIKKDKWILSEEVGGEDWFSIQILFNRARGFLKVISISVHRPFDLLDTGTSSVTPRPSCCLLVHPYVTDPSAGSVCFLSTLLSACLSEHSMRPDPAGPLFVFLLWPGPPGATQPGWEIRIPHCCIADMLSHHMPGSCGGQLKSGTSCLHWDFIKTERVQAQIVLVFFRQILLRKFSFGYICCVNFV